MGFGGKMVRMERKLAIFFFNFHHFPTKSHGNGGCQTSPKCKNEFIFLSKNEFTRQVQQDDGIYWQIITVFGSWSLGCSRLLLAAPAVRLLGLLLAARC